MVLALSRNGDWMTSLGSFLTFFLFYCINSFLKELGKQLVRLRGQLRYHLPLGLWHLPGRALLPDQEVAAQQRDHRDNEIVLLFDLSE